jgi:hypothetical protein
MPEAADWGGFALIVIVYGSLPISDRVWNPRKDGEKAPFISNGPTPICNRKLIMSKVKTNPADNTDIDSQASLEAEKLKEAADRVFSYYFPPAHEKTSRRRNKSRLFTVCPDIDTEALLANASEDLLSISAIAADLADDVEGSGRGLAVKYSVR